MVLRKQAFATPTIYLRHVLFHALPVLWRLHCLYHADLDIDATAGLRFHPLEILLSLGYKAVVMVLLGAVPWVVVAFEVILNAASVFNRGNVARPERLDRWLRWIVVTRTCTASTTPRASSRPIVTLAFRSPGGTGYAAPTKPSRPLDT